MALDEFRQANQDNWNERTHIHAASRAVKTGERP